MLAAPPRLLPKSGGVFLFTAFRQSVWLPAFAPKAARMSLSVWRYGLATDADYHDHEADPVFVPAPHPTDLPVTEAGSERHCDRQTKELGFELHM